MLQGLRFLKEDMSLRFRSKRRQKAFVLVPAKGWPSTIKKEALSPLPSRLKGGPCFFANHKGRERLNLQRKRACQSKLSSVPKKRKYMGTSTSRYPFCASRRPVTPTSHEGRCNFLRRVLLESSPTLAMKVGVSRDVQRGEELLFPRTGGKARPTCKKPGFECGTLQF